jgi:hypothetical protein
MRLHKVASSWFINITLMLLMNHAQNFKNKQAGQRLKEFYRDASNHTSVSSNISSERAYCECYYFLIKKELAVWNLFASQCIIYFEGTETLGNCLLTRLRQFFIGFLLHISFHTKNPQCYILLHNHEQQQQFMSQEKRHHVALYLYSQNTSIHICYTAHATG